MQESSSEILCINNFVLIVCNLKLRFHYLASEVFVLEKLTAVQIISNLQSYGIAPIKTKFNV